ncbi:AMP-binding enzyme [Streptomyces sp. cf386]|uniref:AMP-binding protein n=1 Tax=Streptomyces sp. cf386 TaxID=1761904 RepID=UPI000882FDBD|nr:AMP-binding protein [Streptomyces sp. cf386]SDP56708.1 AMP-binding enzyme [Streptomyces sp. cf386]
MAALAGQRSVYLHSSRSVTYAELERRPRALGEYLTRTGLRRGDRIAIFLCNCAEMMESCLTDLRAGMVGVPLNPRSFDAEPAHFLQDSGAGFVITALRAAHRNIRMLLRNLRQPWDIAEADVKPVPHGTAELFATMCNRAPVSSASGERAA